MSKLNLDESLLKRVHYKCRTNLD